MLIIVLLLRLLWQMYPSLWTCVPFWAGVAFMEYEFIKTAKRINWWTKTPILIGASMNALVTIANKGYMPFLGSPKEHSISLWVVGTGKHLLFLCDRFDISIGYASLGDFFIFGGVLVLPVLFWLFRPPTPKIP